MDNINTNNLDLSGPVCRACLKFGAKNKIFSIHKSTSLTYSYIFSTCFSVKVEFDDGLPKFICRKCLTKLVSFYKYRNVVAANDSKLRQILATNRKESIEDPNKCEKEVKFEFTNSDISKDNGHTSNKDFEIVEPNIKTEIKK
ncbi:hypothetical protein NQ317_013537 [Molorchus minor]|uniref:ZAD domain-containing protein n=1 Tax=Molorchus minor TaxID=1323400 RepID=A0ABQ9JY68_9CUCU|nr:hypothetical protein NQ317_013537 [Molorchus minor]